MGSMVEINDTLQLTIKQGWPHELNLDQHLANAIGLSEIEGRLFTFKNKSGIRNYQQVPVRTFLVQNFGGKWVYWGRVHITMVEHNFISQTSSGQFLIIAIFNPEEMKQAFKLIDGRQDFNYFAI
jgi:hypothetical protein